ncbi:anti-sigma-28 factor, FlgM family [Sphingomonas guangdongensis]|uniref:Negative regulator of flagellin synthesis n=1 Tax=Sphingomonas guangdongensis TaxID=1141890 RepID=A0A285QEB8_9SPHN|nr:flagellar biosynthesis anti-sigma factor FlgM [Sphingomonas guangdongensis]SOB80186.1 anti-sigma-28 factor, FlgM family [Sphingomonas guangdongensis]
MVDPVGTKATASVDRRLAPVAPVSAVKAAEPQVNVAGTQAASTLQALSQPAAASAPVDADRVAKIKKAIQDGNFPLVPSTIADRLLALKLEWKPNDPA